jgi:hypothetical protein
MNPKGLVFGSLNDLTVRIVAPGNHTTPSNRGLFFARKMSTFPARQMYKHARGATGKKNLGSIFQGLSK